MPSTEGISPNKVLKQRSAQVDSAGAELSDYLGYFVGAVLIWFLYTGYNSVVGVILRPDITVIHLSKNATITPKKDKAKRLAVEREIEKELEEAKIAVAAKESARAQLRGGDETPVQEIVELAPKSTGIVDTLNSYVDYFSKRAGKLFGGFMSGSSDSSDGRRESPVREDEELDSGDTLVYF